MSPRTLATGLRVRAVLGAHEAVGIYAVERVDDPTGSVREFQRMRKRRNKSEYGDVVFGDADVRADLGHATTVVAAVRAALPRA